MRLRLFKLGLEGKVAVTNLLLIGCALAVVRIGIALGFPELDAHAQHELWATAGAIAWIMVVVLSFPVGWLSAVLGSGDSFMVTILAAVFLPLNAYLWGYVVAAIVKWRRARKAQPDKSGRI